MNLTLTWDLVIVVLFAVVTAYSYIVGKHQCVKVIVGTYIAAVAVQGIITLIARLQPEILSLITSLGFVLSADLLSAAKLLLFMLVMILISVRGGFEVQYLKENWGIINILITGAFGFSTAALILTTLLTYIAGVPLLSPHLGDAPVMLQLMHQSQYLQLLVAYQDVWFALPALLLLVVGFYDAL